MPRLTVAGSPATKRPKHDAQERREKRDSRQPKPPKTTALAAFRERGTVSGACAAARISRQTWYNWLKEDDAFARDAADAAEDVADGLEAEAVKRAKDGDTGLIMFLLRARRPSVYREKHTIEVVSKDVQDRLGAQADAIAEICSPEVAAALIARLRDVWS